MPRCAFVLLTAVALTGCTTAPLGPSGIEACAIPGDDPAMLSVQSDTSGRQRLIVHSAQKEGQKTFVALDTIGAPQFSARVEAGRWVVERRAVYRGADPEWLLWGWQWWQLREDLRPACAEATGYVLASTDTGWQLLHKGHVYWEWQVDQPDRYELPRQGVIVKLRELESENP